MRTVRDEAFFDLQALRRRIMPIGMVSVACTYCTVWFLGLCIIPTDMLHTKFIYICVYVNLQLVVLAYMTFLMSICCCYLTESRYVQFTHSILKHLS